MDYTKLYGDIFKGNEEYNIHIQDRDRYDYVINEIINNNYKKIIDISSGRGFFIKYLREKSELIDITSTDLSKFNDLDIKFIRLNLMNKSDYNNVVETYDFLSCLDVLEHVEETNIEDIFIFFKALSNNFCFSIANHPEVYDDIEYHLIQKDKFWWDDTLSKHFDIIESFICYDGLLYKYILKSK